MKIKLLLKRPPDDNFDYSATGSMIKTLSQDPFGLFALFITITWDNISEVEKCDWWSEFNHRLLIFFSVICHHYKDAHLSEQHEPLITYTRNTVDFLLTNIVSQRYPDEAAALSKLLHSGFQKQFFPSFPSYTPF